MPGFGACAAEYSREYRPKGGRGTDPAHMLEVLSHYEHTLHELVGEAQSRLTGGRGLQSHPSEAKRRGGLASRGLKKA